MTLNTAAGRRHIREDEEPAHGPWLPAEPICRDPWRQPGLGVMTPESLLDRCELRFHLDDDEGPGRVVPGEQIDGAALAPDRVRDLGPDVPAEPAQLLGGSTHERCVALIEEAVEVAGSPSDRHGEIGIERPNDRIEPPKRHPVDLASLGARHRVLADATFARDILLPPRTSVSERAKDPPDPLLIHAPNGRTRRSLGSWRALYS